MRPYLATQRHGCYRRNPTPQSRTPAKKSSTAVLSPRRDLRSSVPIKKSNRRDSRNPRWSFRPPRASGGRQRAEDRHAEGGSAPLAALVGFIDCAKKTWEGRKRCKK